MTKSAREVIAGMFCEAVSDSCANADEMASYYAAATIIELFQAGYVILPREPSEGMIEAGLQATMAEIFDAPEDSDTLAIIRNKATSACHRAMISHAEGERG